MRAFYFPVWFTAVRPARQPYINIVSEARKESAPSPPPQYHAGRGRPLPRFTSATPLKTRNLSHLAAESPGKMLRCRPIRRACVCVCVVSTAVCADARASHLDTYSERTTYEYNAITAPCPNSSGNRFFTSIHTHTRPGDNAIVRNTLEYRLSRLPAAYLWFSEREKKNKRKKRYQNGRGYCYTASARPATVVH